MAEWVSEVTQLCLALCDPMDFSLPCSSVYVTFQARVLEGVAIAFSFYGSVMFYCNGGGYMQSSLLEGLP